MPRKRNAMNNDTDTFSLMIETLHVKQQQYEHINPFIRKKVTEVNNINFTFKNRYIHKPHNTTF